jgi:metallo-beta-lactamase family protein
MKITFCGGAGTVTGSCYLVETNNYRFLVDCGMFQGHKETESLNRHQFLFNPGAIDFVLLTHAHVDHVGLLPKLWKSGFKKDVFATKATAELCGVVLPDSGHIQEMEVEWRNRKRVRLGAAPEEPLYTAADALGCLTLFKPRIYNQEFEPVPGIRVRMVDAGHILGSAIVEVMVTEEGKPLKIVFSGDLGQINQPIIQDPTVVSEADYLLIESTYGNRLHQDQAQRVELLRQIITESVNSGGNLVIPAFAVGRTQDLLYHIKTLLRSGMIPRVPVYIDSPMAVSVTEIYRQNPDCYDQSTRQLFEAHESPFEFPNLHFIRLAEESKQLNETAKGAVIISANGMCEAGRILHHLKHNLWRPESNILFVGYQAEGTLGKRLLDGAKVVKIMGEEIQVTAKIHSIDGFSAHADQKGLLDWVGKFTNKPRGLFIIHGEGQAQTDFAAILKSNLQIDSLIPGLGDQYNLGAEARLEQKGAKLTADYSLERTLTDFEHNILNLRSQIRQSKLTYSDAQVGEMKKLLGDFENLMKNSKR